MSVRYNVVFSDDLDRDIDRVAEASESNKSEILRKALQLYLAAYDGKQRGLRVGLAGKNQELETEFVGL